MVAVLSRGTALFVLLCSICACVVVPKTAAQSLTSAESIERERARLRSGSTEERIDAVLRLGALARADAARVASESLADDSPRVRGAAVKSLRALPATEAVRLLVPHLRDRDEFVRQEAAYAIGDAGARFEPGDNRSTKTEIVLALAGLLEEDKSAGVRGAAAISLGRIGDARATRSLLAGLARRRGARGLLNRVRRRREPENEFVRRSIVLSLGTLGDATAVPALIGVLEDERDAPDVRREAARALGLIGDVRATPALRRIEGSPDALLSRVALESLARIDARKTSLPPTL